LFLFKKHLNVHNFGCKVTKKSLNFQRFSRKSIEISVFFDLFDLKRRKKGDYTIKKAV